MQKMKVYRVIQKIDNSPCYPQTEEVELAICTSMEYAKKAVNRCREENDDCGLFIVEDEIILDAIYNWDDGDLAV